MHKKLFFRILFFTFIFILSLQVITDTDFGWHLRVGEYILETKQVPKEDLFSFSLPDYPYVYHSWASDTVIFASYKLWGLTGVTVMFSLVSTITLFFLYKSTTLIYHKINHYTFIWIALLAHPIAGARVRTFGLLFLSIIYYLFLKFETQNSKLIWFVPFIFFLWVNFHGSFILGMLTLIIFSSLLIIHRKLKVDQVKTLTCVFLLSLLATIVNPYTIRAWQQAILLSYNSYFKLEGINIDWLPLVNLQTEGWIFALLVFLLITMAYFLKIEFGLIQKYLISIFLLLSFFTSRFVIALFVFFVPTANYIVEKLKEKLNPDLLKSLPIKFSLALISLLLPLLVAKNILEIKSVYSSFYDYNIFLAERSPNRLSFADWPYQASQYVEKNLIDKNILSEANWSGYLLLQNKNFKVYYYGAMDNFLLENRSFAFKYLDLINAKNFEAELEKYQVEVIFLPPFYPLIGEVRNHPNWQNVYEDNQAAILVKKI